MSSQTTSNPLSAVTFNSNLSGSPDSYRKKIVKRLKKLQINIELDADLAQDGLANQGVQPQGVDSHSTG